VAREEGGGECGGRGGEKLAAIHGVDSGTGDRVKLEHLAKEILGAHHGSAPTIPPCRLGSSRHDVCTFAGRFRGRKLCADDPSAQAWKLAPRCLPLRWMDSTTEGEDLHYGVAALAEREKSLANASQRMPRVARWRLVTRCACLNQPSQRCPIS
jgi:hypothetical protein